MKTVLAAKENIAQLWGHPKPKETKYRLLKYLLRCEVEDGVLLHNVVTGQLILLTNEEAESLSNLPANPTELMQELIANHFLVPEDFDEYRSVNQLRTICQKQSTGDAINRYTILPTTFCNAHCFYCYESDHPRVHMTEETAAKVIDYIDEHRKGKDVRIGWFGGEPLVGMDRIDQISQGLKDRGIPYSASMISNGYLFDEDVVERSVSLWNLKRVQITLDGTEAVYNQVKSFANVSGSPYQRVIRNIDLLSKSKVPVIIRLNLDFYNREDIRTLIEELYKRYAGNKSVKVYLNLLYNDQGFEPVHHSVEEYLELLQLYNDCSGLLLRLGIGQERRKIPQLKVFQCMADNPHSVLIQPDGSLCRCEHESVVDCYGSIEKGILDPQKLLEWKEPFLRCDDCPSCCMYPYCYVLRHCMGANDPCNEGIMQNYQRRYVEYLRSVYHKRVEDEGHEDV